MSAIRSQVGPAGWRTMVPTLILMLLMVHGMAHAQAPDHGTICVMSAVQMSVFVDGSPITSGATPCELRGVTPGVHTIVARAEGYKDCSFSVNVVPGRITRAEVRPVPVALRVGVVVDAENFYQRIVGQISYRVIHYTIEFDRAALYSRIQGKVSQVPGLQVVMGGPADFTLRADFHASTDHVSGTFNLVDRQGVVVGSETRSVRMPLGYDDNMTPAGMKRANEIVDKMMPGLIEKMAARAQAPAPAPVIVTE